MGMTWISIKVDFHNLNRHLCKIDKYKQPGTAIYNNVLWLAVTVEQNVSSKHQIVFTVTEVADVDGNDIKVEGQIFNDEFQFVMSNLSKL